MATLKNSSTSSTAMRLSAYRDELKALRFSDEQAWTLVACAARDVHGLVVHAGYLAIAEPPVPIVMSSGANADNVYRERAALVAHLAAVYPSVIAYNDPSEPDWPVIYVDTPQGQLSWHLAKDDLDLFAHVPVVEPDAVAWDGHDTPTKYQRLAFLTAEHAEADAYEKNEALIKAARDNADLLQGRT